MPESKLPSEGCRNSDPPSTQEPGSHIVDVHISAGESDGTESSAQESPQLLVTGICPAGSTADMDRNTIPTDEFVNDNDNDVSEMIDLATSLMAECKAGLSLSNLNNAVFLFRQVIDTCPATHLLHADSMRYLASALGIRFMYTNQIDDLTESLALRGEIVKGWNLDQNSGHNDNTASRLEDEPDTEGILELAKGMLTDFQKSTSLHILNDIVFLVQQSLALLSSASTSRFMALTTLADGLYARFNHSYDMTDLNEAISSLQEAVKCCTEQDRHQSKIDSRICGLLAARFNILGDISGPQTVLHRLRNLNIEGSWDSAIILQRLTLANEFYAQFMKSSDIADLNIAVTIFRDLIEELPLGNKNYAMVINNLANALWTRFLQGRQRSDLDEAISLHRQALELFHPPHPIRSGSLNNLANALLTRFRQGGQQSDLDEAISLHRRALTLQLPPHSDRSRLLDNLANALSTRFKQGGQQSDLNEAISLHRQALKLRLPPHSDQASSLNNLANVLWTRFEQEGQQSDLNEAISLHRQALELFLPPHPLRASSLNNLASALLTQFEQGGQQSDLDEAISLLRQALELQLPSHPNRSSSLNNLASALLTQFKQGGQQSHLNEAISLHRQVLELFLPPHPHRSASLNNLANALSTRFQHGGQQSDLDKAISLHRQALTLQLPPHPLQPGSLNNLAKALLTRFQHGGQQSDLEEAISLHRQALELFLPPHPLRSGSLNNLANALLTQFKLGGQQSDLDEAISLHRQALELRLPPHPLRSGSLNNLASVLMTQFEQGGQQSDLDEAISLHRQALELFRPPHPIRSGSLNNLANALLTRFRRGGQQSDIDEAISLHRQALELRLPPHPLQSDSLNNLANVLSTRFEQGGQQSDIDEAIFLHRQALELRLPPHPLQSDSLNNLANALWIRFQQGRLQSDLNEAISLHRQALELFHLPHPLRSSSLNNLASALLTKFEQEDQLGDLDEAISLYRQALELRLPPHPLRSSSLNNLASILLIRFEQGGQRSDLDEATSLFSTATQYFFQPPSRRLEIAKSWIHCADKNQHSSAIEAYEASLQALPHVAALSLDVESRQDALTVGSDGLARDASRCAIHSGQIDKAIEFLEEGRSIFWSQVLSLRSPFDQLHKIAPELANKLRDIATELEIGSHRDVSAGILDNRKKLSLDQEASRLNRLNEEWAQSINEVRKFSGFEDFLCPSRISSLKSAACKYPVIILLANNDGSHCLIMTSKILHHIPLPNLGTPVLKELVNMIQIAVSQLLISRLFVNQTRDTIIKLLGDERGTRVKSNWGPGSSDDIFKFVLKLLWDELVKPVIDFLNIMTSGEILPVLQWCPTGHFTFLPIHAAGCYNDEIAIDCAPEYFISSYTPTIGTLLARNPVSSHQTFQMMAVIQSKELPSTRRELANIRKHVSSGALIELGVPGVPAGVEAVASRLSDVAIVHFACHGKQNPFKPLESGLKLDDGLLRISRIMKENLPNGSLAFLCACETAMGDQKLPDEAMSIGASLIFSGFRRVIATMWEMRDEDGPTIADTFYEELFRGPDGKQALEPDMEKAALSLHLAVKKLRSQSVSFRRWVPFIYMGIV